MNKIKVTKDGDYIKEYNIENVQPVTHSNDYRTYIKELDVVRDNIISKLQKEKEWLINKLVKYQFTLYTRDLNNDDDEEITSEVQAQIDEIQNYMKTRIREKIIEELKIYLT